MNDTNVAGPVTRAIWRPAWHRLDQPLRVGQTGRFWFFASQNQDPDRVGQSPDDGPRAGAGPFLQFFNRTVSARHVPEVRAGTVVSIVHAQLGSLQSVDTAGLDYRFVASDGTTHSVNAEEDAGALYDEPDLKIGDWSVEVFLHGLSSPLADIA